MTRRDFLMASSAVACGGCRLFDGEDDRWSDGATLCSDGGIRVRFLGCGASGWKPEWAKNPYNRRQSSVLIENKVLIDFTPCAFDMLPSGCRPEVLFQTHSHNDHYNPEAAVRSGVRRIFVHSSVQTVSRIVNAMERTGRFTPPPGQHAYLTHLCIKYRGWPAEKINAEIPPSLRAAYDGLETVLG